MLGESGGTVVGVMLRVIVECVLWEAKGMPW